MKVLAIYHAGAAAGARSIFKDLAKTVDLTVVMPEKLKVDPVYDPSGWLMANTIDSVAYNSLAVPLRDPLDCWKGFDRGPLRRVLSNVKPDVIHVLDEPVSGYLFQVAWERLTSWRQAKVLFYAFENLPLRLRLHRWMKWMPTWRQISGGAAANSEALAHVKAAGFPADRPMERIFWGISTEVSRPMDREVVRRDLKLDCEYIAGFAGRFTKEKGLSAFMESLGSLPKSVHALFIGAGPMREALVETALPSSLAGRVHILDALPPDRMAAAINAMDVLVLPSLTTPVWKEQYGRVIAEAMACGVPVIGSDSGAIPEVIGNAGIVVPEGNSQALAEALKRVLLNEEISSQMRISGIERARNEFSTQAMAARLTNFYQRVMES